MQRIERYGVIALVFLLVTILAVAVWGQRKNQSLLSFLKRDKNAEVAKLDAPQPGAPASNTGLGLSTPTHEVSAAIEQAPSVVGTLDPTLQLAPPAGPGASAVSFDHGAALTQPGQPNAGYLVSGGATAPGLAPQTPIAPAAASPAPVDAASRTYKVKRGDTLGSIAQRELGSTKRWKEIEALNGVKAERLNVGMLLKLPAGASSTGAQALVRTEPVQRAAPAANATVQSSARTYNVRSGDSLSRIAATQLGDANRYAEIIALNPGVDPAKLAIGQSLRMPADARNRTVESKPKPRPSPESSQVARLDSAPKKAKVQ